MITATEAQQIVTERRDDYVEKKFAEINEAIKKSAEEGREQLGIINRLNDKVIKKLEDLDYRITGPNSNHFVHMIYWDKKSIREMQNRDKPKPEYSIFGRIK